MRSLSTRCPALGVTLLLLATSVSAADARLDAFAAARRAFERSLSGDTAATRLALERFQHLVDADPLHPLYLAYLGSSYTLKARDAWMPWTRIGNAEKGLQMIDKALAMLGPDHDEQGLRGSVVSTETRLVAVSTFSEMPRFLNRRQDAKDLLAETLAAPAFDKAPGEVRGRLWLRAAELAEREEDRDARVDYLQKALQVLPPGRFAVLARARLAQAESTGERQ